MNLKKLIDSGNYPVRYNNNNNLLLFPDSVATAILDIITNKILFVKQYRDSIGQYSIELPGGKVNKHESIIEAAKRELVEESGISNCSIENIFSLDMDLSISKHVTHIFFGKKNLSSGANEQHEFECIFIEMSDAYKMVIDGKITHAPSAAAILWITNTCNDIFIKDKND